MDEELASFVADGTCNGRDLCGIFIHHNHNALEYTTMQ